MDLEQHIIDLQTKNAYLEHMVQELNEVMVSQQKQVDNLAKKLQRMVDYLKSNQGSELARADEEVPPPHY
jgi:SlyX protein